MRPSAWTPYEPDRRNPWDRRRAAHLFRRAGFAANARQLDAAAKREPADLIKELISPPKATESYRQEIGDLARSVLAGNDPKSLAAWWCYRLIGTPHQLLEKMTLFWHGHFATSADKVQDARLMFQQNELLRRHALGDFAALVQKISRDPAMLIYLDSVTNRKTHPNENFARELMELFCLGEGNYTEKDVLELARCFTGWEIKRRKFRFNRYQHDSGEKTIFGETGAFGGEDGVRSVLKQPSAPRFIVRKLIRYFIMDEPDAPDDLVEPLAKEFREHDLDIAVPVERILNSKLFFSEQAIGRKVRSPVELAVGLLRALEGTTNVYALSEGLAGTGHALFYPPNVKGWDGGRAWINSSTLLGRANFVRDLLKNEKTRFAGGTLEALVERQGLKKPAAIVDWLTEMLVAVPIPDEARARLIKIVGGKGDRSERIGDAIHVLSTLPESQLS